MNISDFLTRPSKAEDIKITGLTADSRAVKPGYLFAALPGVMHDGAAFIADASQRGAIAILAPPATQTSLPLIEAQNPRQTLAQLAARFYPLAPRHIAGVTGTNGKTSVAIFAQQLWQKMETPAGAIGTLGASAPGVSQELSHTTPDPVTLHHILQNMAQAGVDHAIMEVSSHGLVQSRADAVVFNVAAFTNITQDHLDYHTDFDAYFTAKARLFTDLLHRDGVAIINCDGAGSQRMATCASAAGRRLYTVGHKGQDIRLTAICPVPDGQKICIECAGQHYTLHIPLVGAFQVENALVAAAIIINTGFPPQIVLPFLEEIAGVPGRMEKIEQTEPKQASHPQVNRVAGVFVDYAHTPDAIRTALDALRPHVTGKLHIVFGAGGDRDPTKRVLMGKAAAKGADAITVTDDNPRSEDPNKIRLQIIKGCPQAKNIGDRASAINAAIAALRSGDVLLIAGKGHEEGQQVGDQLLPFSDKQVAKAALLALGMAE